MKSHIWYVSYGANLLRERFLTYIVGGKIPLGDHSHSGCNDRTLPKQDESFEIPAELYFASHSVFYPGGVAFVDSRQTDKRTKVRAYLITLEQFWEVTKQENGWHQMPTTLPALDEILQAGTYVLDYAGGSLAGHTCNYSRILHLGERDGHPMVTFTEPARNKSNKPSPPYIQVIARGLRQSHQLSDDQIAAYLSDKTGIANEYTAEALQATCNAA